MSPCEVVEGRSKLLMFELSINQVELAYGNSSNYQIPVQEFMLVYAREMSHLQLFTMKVKSDGRYRAVRLRRKVIMRMKERWILIVMVTVVSSMLSGVECFVAFVNPINRWQYSPMIEDLCSIRSTSNRTPNCRSRSSLSDSNESPLGNARTAIAIPFTSDHYADVLLSPWEQWCIQQLQRRYDEALTIKCPFFRRRAADILDAMDMIVRFIVIRHKSLPDYALLPSIYHQRRHTDMVSQVNHKFINITQTELLTILREDWKVDTSKGYYVTGKLTTAIYSDDAFFDGPDPDMPVRGLYKYMNAASQLFDVKSSYSELLDLYIADDTSIVARWKMYGKLRLPWKPLVPAWTGTTTYHINPIHGLIDRHMETWDISVWQAFLQTLCPPIARRIWH